MFSYTNIFKLIDLLHIPLEEIESATSNFTDENLLKQGALFKVYKGKLLQPGDSIDIVARKCLQRSHVYNELAISKNFKHENIVSAFRFTFSANEDIIINRYEANESLDKHLRDPTLTWMRRLHICVAVAHALKYIHHDVEDDHNIVHGNIKSSKVLLDENWEPKLHGFAFAGRVFNDQLHRTSHDQMTILSSPYMDPAYEGTKGLTHYKSDVFSFGIVLFEVLFGREASSIQDDCNNLSFAGLARKHYADGKLDELIKPDIRTQMNLQALSIFAEAAWCCLKEQPSQRPDMKLVLSRLEYALELQQKYESSRAPVEASSSNHNHLKVRSLDHLRIRLWDIHLATNNFSDTFYIGSGGYGKVYKAELLLDSSNSLSVKGINESRLPKRHTTVAIKRITSRVDMQGEQGFFTEIEMLSNCRHPNIVSLLGFCDEEHEMILVYEYMSNGNLETYLENTDKMKDFTWTKRIQICLDIANGLNYLHTSIKNKPCIIHRDIKSANILLDDKWVAKIADFGLSKLHYAYENRSTLATNMIAGTQGYLDPEYESLGKLKTKSDVYSFGVVLFEIMCGKSVYDNTYKEKGLPSLARQYFNDGTLEKLVDPNIERVDMLFSGFDQYSFDAFSNIAHQCLAKTQSERPTMDTVVKKLEEALNFQKNKGRFHISFDAIKTGTQNFSDINCIREGRFWKLYKGEIAHANGYRAIVAKRWDNKPREGEDNFWKELVLLFKRRHGNIIGLVGYCYEMNEMIIVYEHTVNGRLDKHVKDLNLTWMKRLEICIDVAKGLEFLHMGSIEQDDEIIHRDIKSGSILLDDDWNAKICNLEWSCKTWVYDIAKHINDNAYDSLGYVDPEFQLCGYLSKQSDIYSLGVVLLEMLCGILSQAKGWEDHSESLGPVAVRHYNEKENLDKMIFEGIKEQIEPQSLAKFQMIAIQCLAGQRVERPEASDVVIQLKEALEFQKNSKRNFHIPLEAIKLATQNFSVENCIGRKLGFWTLYEGHVGHAMKFTKCVVKRFSESFHQYQFEIELLLKHKHENILGLVGYCNKKDEYIIVYEHVSSNGGLRKHVMDPLLTWIERLKICIGVAKGLEFLHKGGEIDRHKLMERPTFIDFNISYVALDGDWNVKICTFMVPHPSDMADEQLIYFRENTTTFSLGVILFEMLCGRWAWRYGYEDPSPLLDVHLAVRRYKKNGNLDKMIFKNIKEQIAAKSLTIFVAIALKCFEDKAAYQSQSHECDIVIQLEKTLEFQLLHDQTSHQQTRYGNVTRNRDENEISKGVIGKLKEKRKIEKYMSTLERKYSRIIAGKKDFEGSLKEALDLFPENENLIEWKQKIEELFGREVEGKESGCENQTNEVLHNSETCPPSKWWIRLTCGASTCMPVWD